MSASGAHTAGMVAARWVLGGLAWRLEDEYCAYLTSQLTRPHTENQLVRRCVPLQAATVQLRLARVGGDEAIGLLCVTTQLASMG